MHIRQCGTSLEAWTVRSTTENPGSCRGWKSVWILAICNPNFPECHPGRQCRIRPTSQLPFLYAGFLADSCCPLPNGRIWKFPKMGIPQIIQVLKLMVLIGFGDPPISKAGYWLCHPEQFNNCYCSHQRRHLTCEARRQRLDPRVG